MLLQNILKLSTYSRVLLIVLSTLFVGAPLLFDPFAELSFEPIKVAWIVFGAGLVILWGSISYLFVEKSASNKAEVGMELKMGGITDARKSNQEKWRPSVENTMSIPALFRLCFWGYFASVILSVIFSVAPSISFWGISPRYHGLVLFGAIFVIALGVSRLKKEHIMRLAEVMLLTGFIVALIGIAQMFLPFLTQWWDTDLFLRRIFSTMGHPNYLADYLILIIPLLYWKFLESSRWYLWVTTGGVMLLALLLTLSRGAWLGLAGSLLFFVLVYAYQQRRWRPIIVSGAVSIAIFVGIIGVNVWHRTSAPLDTAPLLNRLVVTGENLRSIESRLILWPAVVKRVFERPLLGYGPDTFAVAFSPAVPPEILLVESFNSYPDRAHNFFLDSLMNVGLLGTLLLIGVVICALWIVVRSGTVFILALGSALFGHIISQQFEFSLGVHLMIFWGYLGMIFAVSGGRLWPKWGIIKNVIMWGGGGNMLSEKFVRIGVVILSVIVMYFSGSYFYRALLADRMAPKGRYEQALAMMPSRIQYALDEVRRRIVAYGENEREDVSGEGDNVSDGTETMGVRESAQKDEQNIRPLLDRVKDFTAGADYRAYFYEGIYEMLLERYPESYAAFERALALSPSYPPIYRAYGRSLLAGGKYEEALIQFQRYVDLAPPYWKMKEAYEVGELSAWEANRYEIFYKQNPTFDQVFMYIEEAKIKLKSD